MKEYINNQNNLPMVATGVKVKSWSTNCPYIATQVVSVSCGRSTSIATVVETKRALMPIVFELNLDDT